MTDQTAILKCWRVWRADGSATLIDAVDEARAKQLAQQIDPEDSPITQVECLTAGQP